MKIHLIDLLLIAISFFKANDLLNFIRNKLDSQDKELFIVMKSDVEKSQSWLKEQSNYNNKIVDSSNRDAEEILISDINSIS